MKIVVTKKNLNAFKCNYREIIQQKSHDNDEKLKGSISKFSKFLSKVGHHKGPSFFLRQAEKTHLFEKFCIL